MLLITKKIKQKAPPLGSTSGQGDSARIIAKFFTPWSNWTWYMTEYDSATGQAFGLVDGHCLELGYFQVTGHEDSLEDIRGPLGLRVERDLHFESKTLAEVRKQQC